METGNGQWYLVSKNNNNANNRTNAFDVIDRVQHKESGMVMSLESNQRLLYHNREKGCYFTTDGSVMPMTMDHVLTKLHPDLIPVLPKQLQQQQQQLQVQQQGGSKYGSVEEVVVSDLTDAQRPPGTLPGGKWFHQTINTSTQSDSNHNDEKKTKDTTSSNVRLLYRETDGSGYQRYYTQEGNQVADPNKKEIQMVQKSAHVVTPAVNANAGSNHQYTTQNKTNSNLPDGMVIRGPPGSLPGGKWFKQVYKGSRTQNASAIMCCLYGAAASSIASHVPMDERFVYRNPGVSVYDGKFHFFNMAGGIVYPFQGTFHPLPDETFAPLGYINADGEIVGVSPSTIYPNMNGRNINYDNDNDVEKEKKHPPGTQPGGKWHKQTVSQTGKTRFIYRDIVNNGRWFDTNGKSVNPRVGPIVPPVTRASNYY